MGLHVQPEGDIGRGVIDHENDGDRFRELPVEIRPVEPKTDCRDFRRPLQMIRRFELEQDVIVFDFAVRIVGRHEDKGGEVGGNRSGQFL